MEPNRLINNRLILRSLDSRNKDSIYFNYKIIIEVKTGKNKNSTLYSIRKKIKENNRSTTADFYSEKPGKPDNFYFPYSSTAIIGAGPAGLFAALKLAEHGIKIDIYEKGEIAEDRLLTIKEFLKTGKINENSNILCGEGGAGLFSDGKLTCRKRDKYTLEVLKILHTFGAPEKILYEKKPHIGTDNLIKIVKNIREHLLKSGVNIHYNAAFEGFEYSSEEIKKIIININGKEIPVESLILAAGNNAEMYNILIKSGIPMEPKPYALGLRVEHPQEWINDVQYGKFSDITGKKLNIPADYSLSFNPTRHLYASPVKDNKAIQINQKITNIIKKYNLIPPDIDSERSVLPVYCSLTSLVLISSKFIFSFGLD